MKPHEIVTLRNQVETWRDEVAAAIRVLESIRGALIDELAVVDKQNRRLKTTQFQLEEAHDKLQAEQPTQKRGGK